MNDVVYFSKMYQAVPSLAAIQRALGGVFVCSRAGAYAHFGAEYPELKRKRLHKRCKFLGGGHRAMRTAHCIVTGSPYRKALAPYGARKVMVFHGTYTGISPQGLRHLRHFDHLFLNGPRMEKKLLRYQGDHAFRYSLTGYIPFADFPEKNDANRRTLLQSLGLDSSLKTIVYCPTSKKMGSWDYCAAHLIEQISEEYNLILRPHPRQLSGLKWRDKLPMARFIKSATNRKNTFMCTSNQEINVHYAHLLMAADVLISDANSSAEEALFYDTAQLITGLGNSAPEYMKQWHLNLKISAQDIEQDMKLYECGPVFANENYRDWQEAVQDALHRSDSFSQQRQSCCQYIFGSPDKKAAARVARIIKEQFLA